MEKIDIKNLVEDKIASGQTEEALKMLVEHKSLFPEKIQKDIILLSGRLQRSNAEKRRGTLSNRDYNSDFNTITYGVLDMIVDIEMRFPIKKAKNGIEKTIDQLNNLASTYGKINIHCSANLTLNALELHKEEILSWASFINFKDAATKKLTSKVYVDLECFVTPKRLHYHDKFNIDTIKLIDVINTDKNHIVVLGHPGAGKTTTMKKVALDLISKAKDWLEMPIVIRLRDLNDDDEIESKIPNLLINHIFTTLGIEVSFLNERDEKANAYDINRYFYEKLLIKLSITLLNNLKSILILDGFDELKIELRRKILNQIKELSNGLKKSKLILTTRTGDYYYSIENTSEYEISPLTETQVRIFIDKWIEKPRKAQDLFNQITSSPFADTAIRPLTLAHLCALYEKFNSIPQKPKTIYKKTINLLLEEWDLQRGIQRKSKYGEFDIDRKFDFLSFLAFVLTTELKASVFNEDQIKNSYNYICQNFSLPKNQYNLVISELESHNGLFLKSGYSKYEFAHKSIQEYLTAEYIVKSHDFPQEIKSLEFPNEMALSVAIAANPSLYFAAIILKYLTTTSKPTRNFVETFISRMIVENPDFSSDPILAIAFLKLVTYFVNKHGDIAEIPYGRNEFYSFSKLPQVKRSILRILEYYKPLKEYKLHDTEDEEVLELLYINNIPQTYNLNIPKTLYCEKRYLE
jgi:Effector-associated domain 11/NACHT domain